MSQHHRRAGGFRKAMFDHYGGRPVCVDMGIHPDRCRGPIEAEHDVELADGGPGDRAIPRCRHHHQVKTARARAARKGTQVATATATPARKSKSGATRVKATRAPAWVWLVRVLAWPLVVGVAAAYGWTAWTMQTPVFWHWVRLIAATVAASVAVLGCAFIAWKITVHVRRRAQSSRAEALARVRLIVAHKLRTTHEHVHVLGTRWVDGQPVAGRAKYPVNVNDAADSKDCPDLEVALVEKLGMPLHVTWLPHLDTVEWRPLRDGEQVETGAPVTAGESPDRRKALADIERAQSALTEFAKGPVTLDMTKSDAIGPLRVRAHYPRKFRDDSDDSRAQFMSLLTQKLPGRWHAVGAWGDGDDVVDLERRPDMPSYIPNDPATGGTRDNPEIIPFGTAETGGTCAWNVKTFPHGLIAGETGSGKTVLLRTIAVNSAMRCWEVNVADPKRVEFAGLRDWPGIHRVATSIEDIVDLVEDMYEEMDRRYELIEQRRAKREDFQPILFIIDEAREFIERANALWKEGGNRGREHPVIEKWRSIARLGRRSRVHMLVGIQRPDANVFGGEARDNYGFRAALGSMSPEGARMMFQRSDVGRDVPDDVKGRATVALGNGFHEVQVWVTPDPFDDDELTPDDVALLDAIRAVTPKPRVGPQDTVVAPAPKDDRPAKDVPARPPVATVTIDQVAIEVRRSGRSRPVVLDDEDGPVVVTAVEEDPVDEDYAEITFTRGDGSEGCMSLAADTRLPLAC